MADAPNNDIPIEELIAKLQAQPGAADLLIGLVSQQISLHALQRAAPRVLSAGADVYQNAAGTALWYPGGPSRFPILNVSTGLRAAINSKDNLSQVDLTAVGAGADCMFDYLVSPCFATQTAFVFTEGMTFTSASGCTFRGYSTIQGALTAAGALSANDSSTIAICSGTYAETLTRTDVINASLTLLGTGQGNTIVLPGTGSGPVLTLPTQSNTNDAIVISGITFDTTGMNSGTTVISCGSSMRVKIGNCQINVASAADIGVNPGNSSAVSVNLSQVNFTGAGIGVQTSASAVLTGFIVNQCSFESLMAMGVHMRGQVATVTSSYFGSTIGVQFSGASAIQSITVSGNNFEGCTTGIKHTSGNGASDYGYAIAGNSFISCTTSIDLSTLTGNAWGFAINGNTFVAGTTGVKLHATRVMHSVISGNTFSGAYTAGNEISGMTQAQMITADTQVVHNASDNVAGTLITEYGVGHAAGGTSSAAPNPHNLVSVYHDGEQDYTNLLSLLGLDVSTGDIDMYSDAGITRTGNWDGPTGHIGIGVIAASGSALSITKTLAVSSARGINAQLITTTSAGAAAGLLFGATQNATSGTTASFGGSTGSGEHGGLGVTITDLYAYRGLLDSVAGTGAITRAQGFWLPAASWGAGVIPVTTHVLLAEDQGNASTTLAYGLKIAAQTGTAKRSYIADGLALGTDAALKGLLDVYGHVAVLTDNAVRLYDSDNSNYIGLRADSARTTDLTYVLPATDPTASQVLSAGAPSAGVSTLSWVTPTAFPRQWVWAPDAAPAAVIVSTADAQGTIYHSGPGGFTAVTLYVDAETAPGASGLPITVAYGDTNDLDTVASWTTIATYTLSSEKSNKTTSMTNAAVPANRLMRMTVGTIVGSPADCTVTLEGTVP